MSNTTNNVTKVTIRETLANNGITLTDTEFKKTKKDDLIRLLEAVKVKDNEKKVDTRALERQRVVFALVIAWVYQTIHPFSNDKALFYRAKDPKYTGLWLAEGRRLARVTGDALMLLYNVKLSGKQFNRQVALAYNLMIEAGLCHKNGEYIAMNDTERARCVRYYNSDRDFIKDSIAIYERFISRK
jgi:hypothetical protein